METRKRVLGFDHPDTLTSMANLAFVFWGLGFRGQAIQLMIEVVERRREEIGADHPDTLQSICTLHKWQG